MNPTGGGSIRPSGGGGAAMTDLVEVGERLAGGGVFVKEGALHLRYLR